MGTQLRWLPTACPELNVLDCLWRHLKDDITANQPTPDVDLLIDCPRRYVAQLSPQEGRQKAEAFAPDFWLTDLLK